MQREPFFVARSHQEECHNSPPLVVIHNGQHRGRFPQQTQTAEVGLQTDLIRVLEDLPQTSSLGVIRYMTWEQDPRVAATNTLINDWDPVTWLFPPVPLIPL